MKKKFKKLITMLTVVMTMTAVFTMKTHAVSLDYSGGSSSNNTGASATTSGFTVSYDKAKDNICGYRFSVVSASGTPKSGTKAVNVYLSDITIGNSAYSSGQRFIVSSGVAANKKQLANGTKVSSTTSTQGCDYKSGNCGFYSSLPQKPDSIGTWIKDSSNNYQNLSRIYVICGTNLSNATESDYVLTEPIFRMKLAGTQTAATATELAIYGAAVSGGDGYNGGNGNLYNAGSGTLWNLMYYINREFPNALYVSSNTGVYNAVSVKSSGRYTYKEIIQNGYGCSVLTVKNVITIKTDYTNSITHWKYVGTGGDNGNGTFKNMGTSTFAGKSGNSVTIPSNLVQSYTGYYNTGVAGSYWATGTWSNKNIGSSFTQPACNVWMEYYYYPKSVKVVFNKNDGSNSVADQTFTYAVSGNRFGYNNDGTPKWYNNSGQFGGWDREGYTLLGWSESATATSETYSTYSGVADWWINSKVPDPNASGTVNLYAVWKKNTYTDTISHWAWGFNGNGNNGDRNAFHLTNTTFTKNYGDVFALTEADATAIPNGFYLNNTWQIGTSSVNGSWQNYPYGTKFTQKNYNMGFEYDYHPYTYNITYDLDGGTNDPNNHTSYNVLYGKDLYSPTKTGYEFLGWMRDYTNSQITLSALNHNYNYYNVLNNIEPGTEYEITIGNAKTTAGSASQFSCVIYDFTDSKCFVQNNIAFGSNLSFSVTCPASADTTHDIRLLFYSGVAGSTSGIASVYSNVNIKYYLDGINKGCGSAFGSPSELYTELSKRTTGDIKLIAKWKLYEKIAIVPIEPNAPYREKTNVISSFWLVNLSDDDYTPTTGAKVVFSVYNSSGQRIADETQSFVAPKKDKNLAYFGWYVPDGYASSDVTVKAYIDDGPYQYSHTSESYTIASYDTCIEPDTDYNAKAPDGFTVPASPSDSTTSGRWWQWVYSGGAYAKKQFAVANTVNELVLTAPTSPSAYTENGKLYIKSGYGFELSFKDSMYTVSGYTDGSVNECFAPQYYYALFPEYNYTYGRDKCRSIETVSGKKVFVNAADMARQHFTPIYYPDGEYKFKAVLSDCWTPAGMIITYKTVTVQINGNVYDDWYIGRND